MNIQTGENEQKLQLGSDLSRSIIESPKKQQHQQIKRIDVQQSDSNLTTKRTKMIEIEDDLNPRFTRELEDTNVNINEDIQFHCEYTSKSKITDVSWYYNGRILVKQAFEKKYHIRVEEGRSELSILKASFEDVGIYEVKITNSYGVTRSRAFLSINKGN